VSALVLRPKGPRASPPTMAPLAFVPRTSVSSITWPASTYTFTPAMDLANTAASAAASAGSVVNVRV
jgi:hypothetical protein